jgi:hypothetical protein
MTWRRLWGGRFKAWDGVASSYTWTSNTFSSAMTKAAREWMLCTSEWRNTKFAVYKFGGMKRRTVCVRGRETSLQNKTQLLKTAEVWRKETLGKLSRRGTLNRVCVHNCISRSLYFCVLHHVFEYIDITCRRNLLSSSSSLKMEAADLLDTFRPIASKLHCIIPRNDVFISYICMYIILMWKHVLPKCLHPSTQQHAFSSRRP